MKSGSIGRVRTEAVKIYAAIIIHRSHYARYGNRTPFIIVSAEWDPGGRGRIGGTGGFGGGGMESGGPGGWSGLGSGIAAARGCSFILWSSTWSILTCLCRKKNTNLGVIRIRSTGRKHTVTAFVLRLRLSCRTRSALWCFCSSVCRENVPPISPTV